MLAISLSEYEFGWLRKKEYETWAAIRIYSQKDEVKTFSKRFHAQFEDTLTTYFTDIREAVEENGKIYQPFSQQNYDDILAFVAKNCDCDKLFIHCAAGVCRSAGVVVGLSRQFNWITPQHGLHGNSTVHPYPNVVSWFNDERVHHQKEV